MSRFGMLVELIGYLVARTVLPFLWLGRVYVEVFSATPEPLRWLATAAMRQAGSNCDKPLPHGSGSGCASWCARDYQHVSRHVILSTACLALFDVTRLFNPRLAIMGTRNTT
ncbi:hypothetical protein [Bradyrhizobium sp. CB2312]|uniref:hypothetical protein n=1 Tax=Bradyrhizobium sp. CB2312 TaxID=3039155 RepID=UPI0024B06D63|nr:hypothetical protein [Bradyrhizobium sp. CB2312]WFU75046.1 hypothetical protein QA642_13955 [Bradyrhizobium sp. CB2312]